MTSMRALEEADVRRLPFSLETEAALVGAVMLNADAYARTVDIVTAEMFFEALHRDVWRVVAGLIEKGQPVNPGTLVTYLGDRDLGGGMTTLQYLGNLARDGATVAGAAEHAKFVRDLWLRRRVISACKDIEAHAYDAPVETPAEAFFTEIETALEELRPTTKDTGDFFDFERASLEAVDIASSAYKRAGGLCGLSSGLRPLDEALGGLQASDLIIVAGRPGMGKTALATNIAFSVALGLAERRAAGEKTGVVGFNSLEMSAAQLAQRILSDRSDVPFFKLRRGYATDDEMSRYVMAARELGALPLHIDPKGGLTIAALKTRARSLKKRRGLELLVVDYLQLLTGSGKSSNKRVDEVTEITTGLKALAKELNVPIIALSQLSRRVEERDDKRPMLSDLRESGSIEQDADVVMFVYRDDYYLGKAEPKAGTEAHATWERDMRRCHGVAHLIIGKNRHGPESTVELGFDASRTRFLSEPEPRDEEMPPPTRERKAKPSFTAEAAILYSALKSLSITRSTVPTDEQKKADRRLHRLARLVTIDDARKTFAQEAMPEADEDVVKRRFTEAFKGLRKNEVAFYTGSEEAGFFVWMPECVET